MKMVSETFYWSDFQSKNHWCMYWFVGDKIIISAFTVDPRNEYKNWLTIGPEGRYHLEGTGPEDITVFRDDEECVSFGEKLELIKPKIGNPM